MALGVPGLVKRFSDRGRTGAYLAVVEPGTIRTGDAIEVIHRPDHSVTVPLLYRAITTDPRWADEALAARDDLEGDLIDKLTRRATYTLATEPDSLNRSL
jgi:MOSC domain-containing protein YiiM